MHKQRRVWLVVTDGGQFRCFEHGKTGMLLPVADGENSGLGHHARDLRSDHDGRTMDSAGMGRHTIEPHHDYRKLEKHRFAAELAAFLDAACAADKFHRCILVAPARTLGELRALLAPRVKARIWKEVGKDLTGRNPAQLSTLLGSDIQRAAAGL